MRSRLLTLTVTMAIVTAIVSGCGGDGGSSNTGGSSGSGPDESVASTSRSSTEFATQANAICRREKRRLLGRLVSYQKQHGSSPSREKLEESEAKAVLYPSMQTQIDEVRKLGVQTGEGNDQLEDFVRATEQAIDIARERGLASVEELSKAFKRAAKLARTYGIGACAYGYEPQP